MEFMGSMTHREFATWDAYLDEELNQPSRSDHYLMQIAYTIRNILNKNPKPFRAKEFRMNFSGPPKRRRLTEEDKKRITREAKSRWCAMLGIKAE